MTLRFETAPGFFLTADAIGDPTHRPVLLLHGGGQTRHSWGDTARWLADAGWYAVALDARGHGDSDWSPTGDYWTDALVADLRAVMHQLGGRPAIVGASMGGLTAMLALGEEASQPADSQGSALVLVDIAPRAEQKGLERIFRFMSASPDGFATLDEAADAVAAYLPNRPRPTDHSRLEKNLRLKDLGRGLRYYWHWDPAFLHAWHERIQAPPDQQAGQQERLFDAARHLTVPTLIVRGGMSDVVSEQIMAEFLELVPHAHSISVADATHMVAGDSNHAFTKVVIGFLTEVTQPISTAY
jgi:pimeloyl-ACP methyl ester carboxylesterase